MTISKANVRAFTLRTKDASINVLANTELLKLIIATVL